MFSKFNAKHSIVTQRIARRLSDHAAHSNCASSKQLRRALICIQAERGEYVLAARATIKSQYYYRDLHRLPAVCMRQDEIVSRGRWEPVYDTSRKERRAGWEQDASGPMAIITGPLDGEIQMQVIGARYCIAMAPGSRSAFPFRRSSMRSSIMPCARRNLRKPPNLGR